MAESFKYGNGVWATKTGSSMAYNDENGNYKPVPFSVTRDSIATRVNKQGLIEVVGNNKLRIDYTDTSKGVALLEPSRTNSITYSEDFTKSSYWLVSSMTVTSDDTTSPYGTQTAAKIESTGGSVRTSSYTGTNGYAFSIFVKKGNSTYVTLRAFGFTTSIIVGFDLDTLTAQTGGVIEDYGNDWYRLSVSKDISSDADKSGFFYIYLPDSLGSTTSASGNYAYFFGAQLEDADYPTSYIPTSNSTVTRAADVANGAGNSEVFNDSEGVLFVEANKLANDSRRSRVAISDGSASDRIIIDFSNVDNRLEYYVISGGSNVASGVYSVDLLRSVKACVKYKVNDVALWVNGFEVRTDTSATMPSGLSELAFDAGDGFNAFHGKTKRIGYYDAVLTDAELEALTSYTSFTNMANELNLTIK